MKRKSNLLEKLYEIDRESGSLVINVKIKTYNDIFNDLDPAPFRKRDLDQDLVAYLDECSLDIPIKRGIITQFVGKKDIEDKDKEERIKKGFRNYYDFLCLYVNRQIKTTYKKSIFYFFTSIFFLVFSYYSTLLDKNFFLGRLLKEGLNIGGWVFLWEAIVLVGFSVRELKVERKRYERLAKSPIRFLYL